MTVTSVRQALNVVGQPASVQALAASENVLPPFSLRQLVGAPPPGRIVTKSVPLALLQRKFDEFVNERGEPLVKIRLHGESYGESVLEVYFADPIDGLALVHSTELEGLEVDLSYAPNPDFYFSDLNTSEVTLRVAEGGIAVHVRFETEGEELKINNFPDVDFTGFTLDALLRLGHDPENSLIGVSAAEGDVVADVSVDASGLPDGTVAQAVEGKVRSEVAGAMNSPDLNRAITRWVLGGDYFVLNVVNDGTTLTAEYVLPLGGLEPFPETPQAPLDPGLLANIDHIVVVMMENRSFDHMLGYLSKQGGRADIDGLRGSEKNVHNGVDYLSFPLRETRFVESPCHHYECVFNQVNGGKLDGFATDFAKRYAADGVSPGKIMGYYAAAQVPIYDALAREFLVCQRWFASHPGPTFPNRFYALTGRLNRDAFGGWELDNPAMSEFSPVSTKTIFDHLSAQGVSWTYFEHGYSTIRLFERYTFDDTHVRDARDRVDGFFARARAGTLPAVSFVDPDFIDVPPGSDDHPPADVADGQRFVGEVVQALMDGRGWAKTLLVITYDEHGGFYDHVPPPTAPAVSGVDRYGVRVPAFVVSPWVDRGRTSDVVFDHTSIIKTIARRFLSASPPDLGERVTAANDLSMVLRDSARADRPAMPDPPPAAPRDEALVRRELAVEDERDFHALLRSVRARFREPVPSG